MVAALLAFDVAMPPAYLGEEDARQRELVARYAADPCVYVVGSSCREPADGNLSITADMPQLMGFGDVHVETDPASAGIAAYLASKGDPGEVVLYVDVSGTTSGRAGEGVVEEMARRLGYPRWEFVKSHSGANEGYNSSETYLLRR